ncbi:hypothetical protein VPH35_010145 [Triticum aestivum]
MFLLSYAFSWRHLSDSFTHFFCFFTTLLEWSDRPPFPSKEVFSNGGSSTMSISSANHQNAHKCLDRVIRTLLAIQTNHQIRETSLEVRNPMDRAPKKMKYCTYLYRGTIMLSTLRWRWLALTLVGDSYVSSRLHVHHLCTPFYYFPTLMKWAKNPPFPLKGAGGIVR